MIEPPATLDAPKTSRPKAGRIINAAGAIALALFGLVFLLNVNAAWNPEYYGEFGLAVDDSTWIVSELVHGSPADLAHVELGNRVRRPLGLHERLVLLRWIAPRPSEHIRIDVDSAGTYRTIMMQARPVAKTPAFNNAVLILRTLEFAVFLLVGIALVLLRPSKMAWSFYLFSLCLVIVNSNASFLSYIPTAWFVVFIVALDLVAAAGVVGFLVFSVRFPSGTCAGWRLVIDRVAPFMAIAYAAIVIWHDLGPLFLSWPTSLRDHVYNIVVGTALAFVFAGALILLVTYFGSRGLERFRLRWVIAGFMLSCITTLTMIFRWQGVLSQLPQGFFEIFNLLFVALPLAVAYAVIRHRVIDIRILASRSIVYGSIASLIAIVVFSLDWLFSTRLPSSRFEAATYAAVALLIGFSLNALRQRIERTIDVLFFRQWYRAQRQAGTMADAMQRVATAQDIYEPLTSGVASVFSLASAALFERAEDGGFVRVAAYGWPPGTLWHILSNDGIVSRLDARPQALDPDSVSWGEHDLPPGVARPAVIMPLHLGRRVVAILLCGAHENGAGLDRDELRAIRRLCTDAAPVYSRKVTTEFQLTPQALAFGV